MPEQDSPVTTARIAALFYVSVFVTGGLALAFGGKLIVSGNPAATANNFLGHETLFWLQWILLLSATIAYVVVTALFYALFKPAGEKLSLTAAFFSLMGCAAATVSAAFQLSPLIILKTTHAGALTREQLEGIAYLFVRIAGHVYEVGLIFFGFYCLLIGILVVRSTFVPRFVGILMIIAGAGWLTFSWPPLVAAIAPYNMMPGIIGEATLTLWLLIAGVNVERWHSVARLQEA